MTILNNSLDFNATTVGDGASYMWNFNDGTGQVNTQFVDDHQFKLLGVTQVILTVQDMWGMVDQKMVEINVKRP